MRSRGAVAWPSRLAAGHRCWRAFPPAAPVVRRSLQQYTQPIPRALAAVARRWRRSSTWSTTTAPACSRFRPRGPRSSTPGFPSLNANIAFQRPRSFRLIAQNVHRPRARPGQQRRAALVLGQAGSAAGVVLLPPRSVRRQRRAADHAGRARVADRSLRRRDVRSGRSDRRTVSGGQRPRRDSQHVAMRRARRRRGS